MRGDAMSNGTRCAGRCKQTVASPVVLSSTRDPVCLRAFSLVSKSYTSMPMLTTKRFRIDLKSLLGLLILFIGTHAHGFELYKTFQTPEAFLAEVFEGAPPAPKVLNIGQAEQRRIQPVFGRSFPQSRLRYWEKDGKTAWIFDAIGKEGYVPTTSGFVVSRGVLEHLRVLVYRESRGEQVGEPSFLKQLTGSRARGNDVDKPVDNISGATLSVLMMKRMARTAIELDALVH